MRDWPAKTLAITLCPYQYLTGKRARCRTPFCPIICREVASMDAGRLRQAEFEAPVRMSYSIHGYIYIFSRLVCLSSYGPAKMRTVYIPNAVGIYFRLLFMLLYFIMSRETCVLTQPSQQAAYLPDRLLMQRVPQSPVSSSISSSRIERVSWSCVEPDRCSTRVHLQWSS
jgi:hypothetical protein